VGRIDTVRVYTMDYDVCGIYGHREIRLVVKKSFVRNIEPYKYKPSARNVSQDAALADKK